MNKNNNNNDFVLEPVNSIHAQHNSRKKPGSLHNNNNSMLKPVRPTYVNLQNEGNDPPHTKKTNASTIYATVKHNSIHNPSRKPVTRGSNNKNGIYGTHAVIRHKNGTNSNTVSETIKRKKKIADMQNESNKLNEKKTELQKDLAAAIKRSQSDLYFTNINTFSETFAKIFKGFFKSSGDDRKKKLFVGTFEEDEIREIMNQDTLSKQGIETVINSLRHKIGEKDDFPDKIKAKIAEVIVNLHNLNHHSVWKIKEDLKEIERQHSNLINQIRRLRSSNGHENNSKA